MTIETDLLATDGDRPLPDALRARLEHMLVEQTWTSETPPELEQVDAARPVPEALRSQLQRAVSKGAKSAFEGADGPRDLPPALRSRLEHVLVPSLRRREALVRVIAIAASVMLLASTSVAVMRTRDEPLRPDRRPVAGRGVPPAGVGVAPLPTVSGPTVVTVPEFPFDGAEFAEPGAGGATGAGDAFRGPVPPYAFGDPAPASMPPPASGPSEQDDAPARTAPRPPLTIATVEGDGDVAAGFAAYIEALNELGGVSGRQVRTELIQGPHKASSKAIAIVDLSATGAQTTVSGLRAPYLETLATSEAALAGPVFSMGGAPERQARIAVAAVFPNRADGATAAIYRPSSGIFATSIADAFEEELERRGVRVIHVEMSESRPNLTLPADAAFLSLPSRRAAAWTAEAERTDHRPPRGIAGIFSLGALDAVADLPDGTIVASPYALDLHGPELADLLERSEKRLSASLIHGWVTAKALAVAIWRSGADDAREVTAALRALEGWDMTFAPSYRVRKGSNVRVPDALVHVVRDGRFERRGGWRTDLN